MVQLTGFGLLGNPFLRYKQ